MKATSAFATPDDAVVAVAENENISHKGEEHREEKSSTLRTPSSIRRRLKRMTSRSRSTIFFVFCATLIGIQSASALTLTASASGDLGGGGHPPVNKQIYEAEYRDLLAQERDKDGLEAIRSLHAQLDDDQDGTIEPSETGDFIKADLEFKNDKQRQNRFHKKDSEITVKDLWNNWHKSEVYNWTVDQVVEWLERNVELPAYASKFRLAGVDGTKLPLVASGGAGTYLSKSLGITNPIHRSKLNLKAMDLVLFGPPKYDTFFRDAVASVLTIVGIMCIAYAYKVEKRAKEKLSSLNKDMETLLNAERDFKKLRENDTLQKEEISEADKAETMRLREEVQKLRYELERTTEELDDRCWSAPPMLQNWLQITYEQETLTYNAKRKSAEEQMERAREVLDRLKKKQSSLVGAFMYTHGQSIQDIEKTILDARNALTEVSKDLHERSMRWKQIEWLCGCAITQNPGLPVLQNTVKYLGLSKLAAGGVVISGGGNGGGSSANSVVVASSRMSTTREQLQQAAGRMSGSRSIDDLDLDFDDSNSVVSSRHPGGHSARNNGVPVSAVKKGSRESSNELSSNDELDSPALHHRLMPQHHQFSNGTATPPRFDLARDIRSATPPVKPSSNEAAAALRSKREKMMVKSRSQEAGGSIQAAAAASHQMQQQLAKNGNSASEGQLQEERPQSLGCRQISSTDSNESSLGSNLQLLSSASRPSVVEEEADESYAASDAGSQSDLRLSVDGKTSKTKKFSSIFKKKPKKKEENKI